MKLKHVVSCCHHCCDKHGIDADKLIEDAEKWNNNTIEYCVELKRVVERLKKRIEELKENPSEYQRMSVTELQKILGEKNG